MNLLRHAQAPALLTALALVGCHKNAATAPSSAPPADPQVGETAPPPTTLPLVDSGAVTFDGTDASSLAGGGGAMTVSPGAAPSDGTLSLGLAVPPGDSSLSPLAGTGVPPPAFDAASPSGGTLPPNKPLPQSFADSGVTALPGTDGPTSPAAPGPSANSDNMTSSATTASVVADDNAFAVATLQGAPGTKIAGTVRFTALAAGPNADVRVLATLTDAAPGEHGIHIHDKGDCSAFASGSAGEHWNPANNPHGAPVGEVRHAGDLGNIIADANGAGTLSTTLPVVKGLSDLRTVFIGKAVVIHERADDLKSQPSGNAGTPVACGVIKDVAVLEAH